MFDYAGALLGEYEAPKATKETAERGLYEIGGINFKGYATDPNWPRAVKRIYGNLPEFTTGEEIDEYIAKKAPESPLIGTGRFMMQNAAMGEYDVRVPLAIAEHESQFGTKGRAKRTLNPWNIGNDDSGRANYMPDIYAGVDAFHRWTMRRAGRKDKPYEVAAAGGAVPAPPTTAARVPDEVGFDYAGALLEGKRTPLPHAGAPAQDNAPYPVAVIKSGPGPGEDKTAATISGETPRSQVAPGMDVWADVGLYDTPQKKFEILAKHFFPDRDPREMGKRFFMQEGDYYFLDDSGTPQPVTPKGFLPKAKQWVGENVGGRLPEMVGGIVGQTLIPIPGVGAGAGTAAGGLLRRGATELIGGEEKTLPEYALGAAGDFVAGAGGDIVGRGITSGLNRLGRAGTGAVGKRLASDPGVFDPAMMQAAIDQGEKYGIRLTVPEITNSPTLKRAWTTISKMPGLPSEKIEKFLTTVRNPQLQAAINREISMISPMGSVTEAGEIAGQTARGIREGLVDARTSASSPYFNKAFAESAEQPGVPPLTVFRVEGANAAEQSAIDKAVANFDREALIRLHGGFSSRSQILKNFAPEERRRIFRFTRKGAQGPDALLDELKTSYPGMFDEFDTDADMLRAIIDKSMNKSAGKVSGSYYELMERHAMQHEPAGLDWELGGYDPKTGAVDISPVLTRLNKLIDINKGEGRGILQKVQSALTREMQTPGGNKVLVPESRLEGLHNAKEVIDSYLSRIKEGKLSIGDRARRNLMEVKDDLLTIMKKNPDYREGMEVYAQASKSLNDFDFSNPNVGPKDPTARSIVKKLADLPETEAARAPAIVFQGNSPEKIAKAREWFIDNGRSEEWNGLVMGKLRSALEGLKDTQANDRGGLGGSFRRAVFYSQDEQKKLQAAMSPAQFERFSGFMDLLKTTERLLYSNSETAFMMADQEMVKEQAGGFLGRLAGLGKFANPGRWKEIVERSRTPAFSARLADAMIDPAMGQKVMQIKQVPNKVKRAILTVGLMTAIQAEAELTDYENVPPAVDPAGGLPRR